MREPSFDPHPVAWTHEKIARYWDWWSSRADAAHYFSKQVGEAVLTFVGDHLTLTGREVLDFGCGAGHFTHLLAARGAHVRAVDFSSSSVEQTRDRVGRHPGFGGASVARTLPLELPARSFDVVFALEVIEHLFPDDLAQTLSELARLTRTGGHIVLTTPNHEDLAAGEQLCPDCGCVFHRVQHLSSWNGRSLSETMERHGFACVSSRQLHLKPNTRWPRLFDWLASARNLGKPNLLYIGRRLPTGT